MNQISITTFNALSSYQNYLAFLQGFFQPCRYNLFDKNLQG